MEVETSIRLAEGLTVGGSASYSDAKFKDYTGASLHGPADVHDGGAGCCPAARLDRDLCVANYVGQRLTNAPKWSYNLNAAYERPVAQDLKFDASFNWSWRDDAYAITADPKSLVKAYGLLNAGVGIGRDNGAGGWGCTPATSGQALLRALPVADPDQRRRLREDRQPRCVPHGWRQAEPEFLGLGGRADRSLPGRSPALFPI